MNDEATARGIEAMRFIQDELDDRLRASLDEPDLVALATALTKALLTGWNHATAAVAAGEEVGVCALVDIWAERFGEPEARPSG